MKNKYEARQDVRTAVLKAGRSVCFIGGDGPDTSGQNEAARMNAEISNEMWGQYKETYLPMEKQFATEAFNTDTEAKRQEQAGLANADVTSAFANQREKSQRQMASMGLDPSSGAWANNESKMGLAEAAAGAGAQNAARRNVENMGYARKQDAISIGKGMPGTAAASMAQSGNQYGQIANANMQNDQNQAAGLGNTVGGAAALYGMAKADGGYIEGESRRVKDEPHLAGGGMAGNPRMQQVMVSPNVMPVAGGGKNNAVSAGLNAVKTYKSMKNAAEFGKGASATAGNISDYGLGEVLTNNSLTTGAQVPGVNIGSEQAAQLAQQNLGLGQEGMAATAEAATTTAATEAGTAAATDAAATAATETAAAGTAAVAGEAGTAAALASNPVGWAIGAGLLASQLLKKDGGLVSARQDLSKGGKIKGKGTETSDSIPAKTRSGSYILNADTVKMLGAGLSSIKVPLRVSKNEIAVPPELVRVIGKAKLDQLNQAGLKQRYGLANVRRNA